MPIILDHENRFVVHPFFYIDQTSNKSQKLGFYDKIVTRQKFGEISAKTASGIISKGFKLVWGSRGEF